MEITERDYDILVDTEIIVDVMLGNSDITVEEFLKLGDGDIISLDKTAGAGGDLNSSCILCQLILSRPLVASLWRRIVSIVFGPEGC